MEANTLISFDNLLRVLNEYGAAIRNEYQDNLIRNDRIASGDLLNNAEFEVVQDNMRFLVNLHLRDYWRYIEDGAPPHWPPVDEILKWIKVKPVLPQPDENGRLPKPESLAFLIARKISVAGTEGSKDLHEASKTINEEYREKIIEAFRQDVQDGMHGMIIEFFQ
jgi:hypothetical protein